MEEYKKTLEDHKLSHSSLNLLDYSLETDQSSTIVQTMKHINENMPHIKTVVVDDFQYVMANEFMRRANERGFDKFTEIGLHAWEVAHSGKNMREDITFVMIGHAEQSTDLSGNRRLKFKTVGKLVDNVITMEGYMCSW